jgi:TPR repeat protein
VSPAAKLSLIIFLLAPLGGAARAGAAPAIAELRTLAHGGDPEAALVLGMRYRDGDGVPRDEEEALKWYRLSADQGHAAGMDNVGFMHLRGLGVPQDFNIAAAYFKGAAAKGDDQGLFNLGGCYFSGQGVDQDYSKAIEAWQRATRGGNRNAMWRLAVLHAAGEGLPQDREKAAELCEPLAEGGDVNAMLLMGELSAIQGKREAAQEWWGPAAKRGSKQAKALLELAKWRHQEPVTGAHAYVEVDHLYQGWNNCGSTTMAMLARHRGSDASPYDIKRLCPRSPIGTGTDWADLVAAGESLDQPWEMVTFSHDAQGFDAGVEALREHLDAGRPVAIDFTVAVERDGKTRHFGHTLLVVGYHTGRDQFVLKNPNQPPPGIELMTAEELKASWVSRHYTRFSKSRAARPLIVIGAP